MRERGEKERTRERSTWRERECTGRSRFESETRGSHRAYVIKRGSRPAFKSGHEKNADADVSSASR